MGAWHDVYEKHGQSVMIVRCYLSPELGPQIVDDLTPIVEHVARHVLKRQAIGPGRPHEGTETEGAGATTWVDLPYHIFL
jgi:hypothetical protein